jgi:hypothetical protein
VELQDYTTRNAGFQSHQMLSHFQFRAWHDFVPSNFQQYDFLNFNQGEMLRGFQIVNPDQSDYQKVIEVLASKKYSQTSDGSVHTSPFHAAKMPSFAFQTYSELSLMEVEDLLSTGSLNRVKVDLDTIGASFKGTNTL